MVSTVCTRKHTIKQQTQHFVANFLTSFLSEKRQNLCLLNVKKIKHDSLCVKEVIYFLTRLRVNGSVRIIPRSGVHGRLDLDCGCFFFSQ